MIGIANGAVLALVALGYTLVYGIIELINFAHGDLFMLGSFVALTVVGSLGFTAFGATGGTPAWLAILIALVASAVFCGVLNVLIERIAYRRLRHAPRLAPLISAIGVSFILLTAGLYWKGPSPQNFPNLIPDFDILRDVFGMTTIVQFNLKEIFVIATANDVRQRVAPVSASRASMDDAVAVKTRPSPVAGVKAVATSSRQRTVPRSSSTATS